MNAIIFVFAMIGGQMHGFLIEEFGSYADCQKALASMQIEVPAAEKSVAMCVRHQVT